MIIEIVPKDKRAQHYREDITAEVFNGMTVQCSYTDGSFPLVVYLMDM